uniref:PPM-type phosphatase domain-containing protein n=1 Tax=Attheya septentrionalis TaxID=420275 RepID=A0A7S2XKK6_9STRA
MGKQTPAHERSGGLALSSRRRTRSRLPTSPDDDGDDDEYMQDNNLLYGYSEMPGKRIIMEDAICAHYPLIPPKFATNDDDVSSSKQRKHWVGFFGVFDGHGDGGAISKYVAEHVVNQVCGTNDWQSYMGGMDCLARSLTKACTELDADMSKLSWSTNGGSTGIMAMISGDSIVVANVGDSRCILIQSPETNKDAEKQTTMSQLTDATTQLSLTSTEEQTDTKKESHSGGGEKMVVVKALSEDHKPDLPVERKRIEEAGLTVVADTFLEEGDDTETTIYKIQKSTNNKIAVSRAFGDFDYKDQSDKPSDQQAIVATPEIQIHARDPNRDLFLVLACDGVWDVMTNQEVGDFCAKTHAELLSNSGNNRPTTTTALTPEQVLPEVGDRLLKECVEVRGTRDNVSVLIVNLENTLNQTNLGAGTAVRALQFDD